MRDRLHDIRLRALFLYAQRLQRSPLRPEFRSRIVTPAAATHRHGWIADIGRGPGLVGARIAAQVSAASIVEVDIDRRTLARRADVSSREEKMSRPDVP